MSRGWKIVIAVVAALAVLLAANTIAVDNETKGAEVTVDGGQILELSGFIAACALVRPTGIEGMKPKSVRKKLKQPSFAAKVDRDQIQRGIEDLGVDEGEHIQFVIDAMAQRADELGLNAEQVSG